MILRIIERIVSLSLISVFIGTEKSGDMTYYSENYLQNIRDSIKISCR